MTNLNSTVQQLVKVAKAKGVTFQLVDALPDNVPSDTLGYLSIHAGTMVVTLRKVNNIVALEETITHELCHVVWCMAKGALASYCKERSEQHWSTLGTSIAALYPMKRWAEETFCYSLEKDAARVLELLVLV